MLSAPPPDVLAALLLGHLPARMHPADAGALRVLGEQLHALLAEAHAAWPGTASLPADDFLEHLAFHLPRAPPLPGALAGLCGADLLLAWACARGVPAALQDLETRVLPRVLEAVRRVESAPAFVDEAMQVLRERLLVRSSSAPPRIAEFCGRGSLVNWLRAVALRIALELQRRGHLEVPHDTLPAATDRILAADPELGQLQLHYHDVFRAAFNAALGALGPGDQRLLRLQHVEGRSVDEVGALLQVPRSTVARWIARARQRLLQATHAELGTRLGLAPHELESLIRMVRSRLDLSLSPLRRDGA
jgi:RNA polymerase sigma-70 factor, ECF subfamily